MVEYTPFDKPLQDISTEDIYSLEVPEGYYVEYKRALIEREKIAKIVASFANTYGGTMLIGIDENSEDNTPEEYFCLGESEQDYKEKLRGIVNSRVDPPPRFSSHILKEETDGGMVIVVSIPESRNTPHINNDGKIYRRTGEQSQPFREVTDSDVLDRLYERRSEWRRRLANFCNLSIDLTRGQDGSVESSEGWPYLELYGIPSTLGEDICSEVLEDIEGFRRELEASELYFYDEEGTPNSAGEFGVANFAYRGTNDGVVAQDLRGSEQVDNIAHTPTTITFFSDGGLKVFLPVSIKDIGEIEESNYQAIYDEFGDNMNTIRYLDGKTILSFVSIIMNSYVSLLEKYGWTSNKNRELYTMGRTVNTFRTTTLFSGKWYQEIIQTYGVPVCYEGSSKVPRVGYHELNWDIDQRTTSIFELVAKTLQALGIPTNQRSNIEAELVHELQRLRGT